ncbi:inactive transglutaminase family protein [Psychromonas sp. CD1]|uniref:inactive transglutaminase family protein n=1 Tax=Psychromonas sp. CD1 TaxID=1979839 RepID=UPI000B9B78BC|nr:inactive transglutaminase family protein [Psychromonas sp. CD1]
MKARFVFFALVTGLFSLGVLQTVQRHISFNIPWVPGVTRTIWNIDAKITFNALVNSPITASLTTPKAQKGFVQISQSAASPGYGLSYLDNNEQNTKKVQWTIRSAEGKQTLYYNIQMMVDNKNQKNPTADMPPIIDMPYSNSAESTAGNALIKEALKTSADAFSLTREILKKINAEEPSQNVKLLLSNNNDKTKLLMTLLNRAKIASRHIGALNLEDGRRRQHLQILVEVFEMKNDVIHTQIFEANSTNSIRTDNLLLWDQSGVALLELSGGEHSNVSFSMIKQEQPALSAIIQKTENAQLFDFSIHSLPVEDQALFKGILMIPLGVLVVVLMRVLIGLKTSGTFMPVLIAMAFIQTSLITGIIGFTLLVAIGLFIRSYLSQLNLLLVSRISTVIIMVILLIAMFGVLSYKLGLTEGLKITFFPMIILSWTIERMSVLWEEEGPKEVLLQGGGSLLVAIFAYFVMSNDIARHLMFNFIGLQFVIMSFVLLLGSYTGYRLLELRRFKPLVDQE